MRFPRFRRKSDSPPSQGDMRTTPVDNPLDWRDDGSIRPGDPAYNAFMEMFEHGNAIVANQRPDGTWDVKELPDDRG